LTTVTQAVEALVRRTVAMSDAQMGEPWVWGQYDEEGRRFALLMTHHELRDLSVRLAAKRTAWSQAQAILAQYHHAYRDLTGVLAALSDAELDRVPAPEEWPVREVAKHMLGAEYGFLRVCSFGLARRRAGNAAEPTDAEWDASATPIVAERDAALASLSTGDVGHVRNVFADIHIRVLRDLGGIADGDIDAPAWFWDGPMPLRFRLHRFEEHLRQHTIQLDKTLAMIGRPPTEAHRLIRNVYNALADVEMEPAAEAELRALAANVILERASALAEGRRYTGELAGLSPLLRCRPSDRRRRRRSPER
jgi:hypothetical protein